MINALKARLTQNGLNDRSPGWLILSDANLLPPLPNAGQNVLFGDTVAVAMRKLMQAFFDYGRIHWRWTINSAPAAGQGGLVRGLAHNCACATFNYNLKFLAENCCGIQGIQLERIEDHFLTVPGASCIDRNWQGNVRTLGQTFQQLRCFKFSSHYWLSLNGQHYDACFNNTFVARDQIIFTLLRTDDLIAEEYQHAIGTTVMGLVKPLPNATHLIEVAPRGSGPGGWPGWELVNQAQLKKL